VDEPRYLDAKDPHRPTTLSALEANTLTRLALVEVLLPDRPHAKAHCDQVLAALPATSPLRLGCEHLLTACFTPRAAPLKTWQDLQKADVEEARLFAQVTRARDCRFQ